MTISKELLAQVNLKEYTDEEIEQKQKLFLELFDKGERDLVRKLDIPIAPWAADRLKRWDGGVEQMIKEGANLSLAVKEYGYEWLTD